MRRRTLAIMIRNLLTILVGLLPGGLAGVWIGRWSCRRSGSRQSAPDPEVAQPPEDKINRAESRTETAERAGLPWSWRGRSG